MLHRKLFLILCILISFAQANSFILDKSTSYQLKTDNIFIDSRKGDNGQLLLRFFNKNKILLLERYIKNPFIYIGESFDLTTGKNISRVTSEQDLALVDLDNIPKEAIELKVYSLCNTCNDISSNNKTKKVWKLIKEKGLLNINKNNTKKLEDQYEVINLTKSGKLKQAANSKKMVDVVIFGDGYTKKEKKILLSDALKAKNSILETYPFSEYKNYLNFKVIFTPSNESKVGDNKYKDTYFKLYHTDRYFSFGPKGKKKLYDLLSKIDKDKREIVLLFAHSNGGGGAYYGKFIVVSSSSNNAITHEIGHQLGGLADEYTYTYSLRFSEEYCKRQGNNKDLYLEPNLANELTKNRPHWKKWIDTNKYPNIGLFEGAWYCKKHFYRPTSNSLMRELYRPFEEVNSEAIIKNINHATSMFKDIIFTVTDQKNHIYVGYGNRNGDMYKYFDNSSSKYGCYIKKSPKDLWTGLKKSKDIFPRILAATSGDDSVFKYYLFLDNGKYQKWVESQKRYSLRDIGLWGKYVKKNYRLITAVVSHGRYYYFFFTNGMVTKVDNIANEEVTDTIDNIWPGFKKAKFNPKYIVSATKKDSAGKEYYFLFPNKKYVVYNYGDNTITEIGDMGDESKVFPTHIIKRCHNATKL